MLHRTIKASPLAISDASLIEPKVFGYDRGFYLKVVIMSNLNVLSGKK
jgi:hypothetical protein